MMKSTYRKMWHPTGVDFPEFSGTRIMMMPVIIGSLDGVPDNYAGLVNELFSMSENRFHGDIGYLTIDEKELKASETLRRAGLHVDGYYHGRCGAWGGGGGWGSVGNGMLTVSSTPHCKAYLGMIDGEPESEGECDHLDLTGIQGEIFEANQVYWVDGACVHESMPVKEDTKRQFVRLSMPNNGPWFEGYTENPTGIKPSAEIFGRRKFMNS